jgi:bacterioferritin
MVPEINKSKVVRILNSILESELAGVVRYTHYSFMVFGFHRIPITAWLRAQAAESLTHAQEAGRDDHALRRPSVAGDRRAAGEPQARPARHPARGARARARGLTHYKDLLDEVRDRSVLLEEYARRMVQQEDLHIGEVDKMLRAPGMIESVRGDAPRAKKRARK